MYPRKVITFAPPPAATVRAPDGGVVQEAKPAAVHAGVLPERRGRDRPAGIRERKEIKKKSVRGERVREKGWGQRRSLGGGPTRIFTKSFSKFSREEHVT